MLLIKKKSKKKTFIIADIKDEEEGIKDYAEQLHGFEDEGDAKDAKKIRHILEQEKQHKKILEGIKKSTAVITGGRLLLKVR